MGDLEREALRVVGPAQLHEGAVPLDDGRRHHVVADGLRVGTRFKFRPTSVVAQILLESACDVWLTHGHAWTQEIGREMEEKDFL